MKSKSSDPEIYFFGHIEGATASILFDGLFLEAIFEAGKDWELKSEDKFIQTQTSYANVNDFYCFNQPFELKYKTESFFGWPKIVIKVWKLDSTGTIDFISYGTGYLPNKSGYHELSIDTFSLHGNEKDETFAYFLDAKPILPNLDPVSKNVDYRMGMISKFGPKIHITVEVLFKNFTKEKCRELARKQDK